MTHVAERTRLVDEFSHQVRRHFPVAVWKSLFMDRTSQAQFGTAVRTVLCVECPESGPLTRDGVLAALARLVRTHGGRVDPCSDEYAFVSFAGPREALRVATELQRAAARARLRMGMLTARCNLARGQVLDCEILMLLGEQRARAGALADRAAAGTVQMSPETYDALEGMGDDLGSYLVMAEFENDLLTEISLTIPPDVSADVSTFAGLGLT
jgi:hypothetical protein